MQTKDNKTSLDSKFIDIDFEILPAAKSVGMEMLDLIDKYGYMTTIHAGKLGYSVTSVKGALQILENQGIVKSELIMAKINGVRHRVRVYRRRTK